jgi:glycosyl transferase family 87
MQATYLRAASRAAAVIGVVAIAMSWPGLNLADSHAYWAPPFDDLYGAARTGGVDAYLYAPPFAQALAPLKALPWAAFAGAWLIVMALCLVAIGGPWAILLAFIPPVLIELQAGNIHLLLALAIGLGIRYPSSWAFALLTKPTLGIGLLWFVVRREWRHLAIALGTTAIVAAVSFVVAAAAWGEWIAALVANAGQPISPDYSGVIHIPLVARLVAAAVIVTWGARTDRRWTIGVAATLALPVLWINGLAVLLAVPMLLGPERVRATAEDLFESGRRRWDAWATDRNELTIGEEADSLGE